MMFRNLLQCGSTKRTLILVIFIWNMMFVFYFHGSVKLKPQTNPLTVLIWHWPFDRPLELYDNICSDIYGINNCHLTANRSRYNDADVVVFHHRELDRKSNDLPSGIRLPGQKWVWATLESPSNIKKLWKWNNIFNWTLSYRNDSDIFAPYGMMVSHTPLSTYFNGPIKTGLVTWVISNYHHSQERASFFKNVSSYLKVDVYGRAAKKPLCPSCLLPTVSRYYFYLALENSIHRDYITEKLWKNSFIAGAVPIVLGPPRHNYEKFIPPDSFIHISDFPSPEHLANFLESMTTQQYQQFFRWRKQYSVKTYTDWRERFCTICSKYSSLPPAKVYSDLEGWFMDY
ncbi:alpha-(1,3)-fucosyltransferase 7 [Bombina bombina]|uniref:alpha-(1,3)-fucosyltransferase 7 n=1 Tax=Bombina bombina TaxID=8345 RepID=UPI00235AAABD|nr:alpha-(1,3)-fucosyltransferase 7 [Bombina bombina]